MKIHNTYLFGEALDRSSWTPAEIEEIGRRAQAACGPLRGTPREYIVDTLARAGKLFEKGAKYRKAALSALKGQISFSPEVIDRTLEVIPELLDRQALSKRLNMELFLPYALETSVERRGYEG